MLKLRWTCFWPSTAFCLAVMRAALCRCFLENMVVTVFALDDDASELVFCFFFCAAAGAPVAAAGLSLEIPGGTLGCGVNVIQGVARLG
jgi:hypothetical protein